MDTLYGPGWPVAPVTRPEDTDFPRTIDYPVSINATLQPRIGYAGLMPIAALTAAYVNISEVSMPPNLIIRELSGFVPMLRLKSNKQRVKDGHPFNWMTISPDRKVPFNVWMSRFKKSAKMYAAPAFYKHRGGDGVIDAMEFIDGSTLFLIVNTRGDLPEPNEVDPEIQKFMERMQYGSRRGNFERLGLPDQLPASPFPESVIGKGTAIYARDYLKQAQKRVQAGKALPTTTPAFTQVIKGIPFSFWDKDQIYFMPEPPAPSVSAPYGETFIERAWTWIQVIAVMTAFEIGHYRTGNMPEGFVTMPKDWFPSMAKLGIAEKEFNARMAEGSQVQHARLRMFPDGSKYFPTKKPDFPKELYNTARDAIALAIGVPPSEIGQIPGRGLGGAGFQTGESQKVGRQLLEGEKNALENAFNRVLIDSDVDDVEWYLDYPQEEVDPAQQQEDLWNKFIHGVNTLNDCLTAQDKEPIGEEDDKENIANMHLIVAGNSIFVIEKMTADPTGMVAPINAQPNQAGGPPVGPEDAALQDKGAEHNPDDQKTAKQVAAAIEQSGGKAVATKFISLPAVAKAGLPKLDGPVTTEFASQIYAAADAGTGPDADTLEQFRQGLEEEQEHADITHGDPLMTAKIVLAHLREDVQYYTHLKQKISKRYKVVGNDVINIDTGELVPGGHHDNHADAVAHMRALYANVPDVKKADITDHDGAMVAVFIPDPVARKLREIADGLGLPADAQQELAENMHITLAFLPDTDQAEIHAGEIVTYIKSVALRHGPLSGNIQGFGVFNGKDGMHVLYATLDCADLPFIRTEICDLLSKNGQQFALDHGFVPHITLAYFPDDFQLPEGFAVPDMPCEIDGVTLAIGSKLTTVTFRDGDVRLGKGWGGLDIPAGVVEAWLKSVNKKITKVDWAEYFKHCGVCPEDAAYFGAPISREIEFEYPASHHANQVEIVAMSPDGMPPQPALWKPEGGENLSIQEKIGGPQYVREEAAWLLDQCLGFAMVPLAYVTEASGEQGSAIWYTAGNTEPQNAEEYGPEWIERAAVIDYIMSQQDRGNRHNFLSHPDDPKRIVLIDNGFSMPADPKMYCKSIFCDLMVDKPLRPDTLMSIRLCLGDAATWRDIQDVLADGGGLENATAAVAKARACAQRLLDEGMITAETGKEQEV